MKYSYYPGCSLHASASDYDESVKEVCKVLGIELEEVEDWNCCGATAASSTDRLVSLSLPARNLAKSEEQGLDMTVPCNSCYVAHKNVNQTYDKKPDLRGKVDEVLEAADLSYSGEVKVKHLLDVLVNDYGLDQIICQVLEELEGVKAVPYYGCQIVRPDHSFDDPEMPTTLDELLEGLGVEVKDFNMKTKCCGGALMTTKKEMALELNYFLLKAAVDTGAEMMVVTCPLCQMNLDAFQDEINQKYGTNFEMPIVYFTQLLGLALGIEPDDLGLEKCIVQPTELIQKYAGVR